MSKPLSIQDFMKMFPDDDACLEHLFKARYGADYECPRCGKERKFSKLSKMPAYACQCGEHIHPMAGTIFHRSHTPLQKWYYAMYLFTTTRHGVPAKELQRQLSVSYETAWRMGHEIRKFLATVDGDPPLSGHVEIDETMVGGKRPGKRGRGAAGKTTVMGMLERGGNVMTRVVENVRCMTLEPHITANVEKGSTVSTDELKSLCQAGAASVHSRHRDPFGERVCERHPSCSGHRRLLVAVEARHSWHSCPRLPQASC